MKQLAITLFICLAALGVNAQKDTVIIRDTVPVPLYQVSDTLPVSYLYESPSHAVYRASGYVVITGFKVQNGKTLQWAAEPKLAGILDSRKRPVKGWAQILN